MPVSVEDVLGATQYRSMSRAGRMTESLTSKTRNAFHAKVSKQHLARSGEDPATAPGTPAEAAKKKKPASEKQTLKLLSVAEVADVDPASLDKKVRAALPLDLVDERVEPLCSSGRDHPEVKAKAEVIVTLEKEIAFHKALEPFHGGVQTAASRQSAEAVSMERVRQDREEAARRANALGLTSPTAPLEETTGEASGEKMPPITPKKGASAPKALSPAALARASTPSGGGHSPLSNPTAANRASPAFAAKGDRFASPATDAVRGPPVGHYHPRYNVVETSSPRSKFPKNRRVLNPAHVSPYRGDRMSPEERAIAEAEAKSPSRRNLAASLGGTAGQMASATFGSVPSSHMLSGTFSGGGHGGHAASPGSQQLAVSQQPPGTAPAAVTRGRVASPSFVNRGRDAPVMTRGGGTPLPGQQRGSGGGSSTRTLDRRSQTPGFPNDAALRPRGPSAALDFARQIGREERDRKHRASSSVSQRIADTATMPLRDGSKIHNRGGNAFSFDGYASREQVSRARDRRPEDEAQRYYDRSAIDTVKYTRPVTVDFGRSPSRAQHRSGMPPAPSPSADSHVMSGDPPEKPRPHSPTFDMDKAVPRPPIEIQHQSDLQYEADDSAVRPVRHAATIGTSVGHDPDASPSRSRVPKPADKPRYLPSHEELDSPQVRRKLAHSIDFGKMVDRDHASHDQARAHHATEPAPIPAERLDRAYEYLSPSKRGDPRIGTHVSRAKREAVAASPPLTSAVDHTVSGDDASKPNLRLGYVSMGRMTERDRHTGNFFANESRTITRLFDKSPARGQRGGEGSRSRSRKRGDREATPASS